MPRADVHGGSPWHGCGQHRGSGPNTCLQIAVIARVRRPGLGGRLPAGDRGIPPQPGVNDANGTASGHILGQAPSRLPRVLRGRQGSARGPIEVSLAGTPAGATAAPGLTTGPADEGTGPAILPSVDPPLAWRAPGAWGPPAWPPSKPGLPSASSSSAAPGGRRAQRLPAWEVSTTARVLPADLPTCGYRDHLPVTDRESPQRLIRSGMTQRTRRACERLTSVVGDFTRKQR